MAFLKKLFGSKREPITKSPDQQLISKIGSKGSATAVTSLHSILPSNYKAVTYESPYREGALNVLFFKVKDEDKHM
ncbi:hypothetical protein R4681_16000 [Acinetobacter baumannii]|nr:hypothetical protein [Acinetobacter baumannii]